MNKEHDFPYRFYWKNDAKRACLFGKRCRIVSEGSRLRSILIEFEDGYRMVTSQRAIRRA